MAEAGEEAVDTVVRVVSIEGDLVHQNRLNKGRSMLFK